MSVTRIRHSLSSGLTFDFSTYMIQSSWFSSISLFAAHAHKSVPHVYICVFVCLTIFYFWTDFHLWPWIQMHIIVHHSVSSCSLMRKSANTQTHTQMTLPPIWTLILLSVHLITHYSIFIPPHVLNLVWNLDSVCLHVRVYSVPTAYRYTSYRCSRNMPLPPLVHLLKYMLINRISVTPITKQRVYQYKFFNL